MILTEIGKDIISVDESNYLEETNKKIHIINLTFKYPNKDKMNVVLDNFKKTNRFVVNDNVKLYNNLLRNINKKYYVSNNVGDGIVTFFKKNNKVVLNTFNLTDAEDMFLYDDGFLIDVLCNLEVMVTHDQFYENKKQIFENWPGNLILSDGYDF